jgi:predicted O-methyltransferase YrrM
MSHETWKAVDAYFAALFAPEDPALTAALDSIVAAGMPSISVSAMQGKLLYTLARSHNARRILEIGTLGAYSTIWLARALPTNGRIITLEIDPKHAEVARANLARAGLSDVAEIRLGAAAEMLAQMVAAGEAPFDMVFIDADKVSTADYVNWSLRLTRPGSLIIIDNVVRNGGVADPNSTDPNVQGIQRGMAALAAAPNLVTTVMQLVGSKGYDGMTLSVVTG